MGEKEYKLFSAKRWTEPLYPIPSGNIRKFTEEEKQKNRKDAIEIMIRMGIIEPGDEDKVVFLDEQ